MSDSPPRPPFRRIDLDEIVVELLPACAYEARYTPERAIVGFAFDGQTGRHAFGSDRIAAFDALPNGLAHVPAGCDVFSESPEGGEYLRVLCAEPAAPRAQGAGFRNVVDPLAARLAHDLRRRLLSDDADQALAIEARARALAARVEAAHQPPPPASRSRADGMTPWRRRTIEAWIDANLSNTIRLSDMAAAVGLSPRYFAAVFAAAFGRAPYDYVVDRRIARARRRIGQGCETFDAVAEDAGFASHAHMSAAFRKRVGAPPSAFRPRARR